MAARSPEPAKRWLLPQSASAVAAGRCRVRTSSSTSMAALMWAPGRMAQASPAVSTCRNSLIHMIGDDQHAEREGRRAPAHLVGPDVDRRMHERVSTNSQASTIMSGIGALGDQRERHHRVEQHRQLELVALVVGALGGVVGPGDAAHGEVGIAALAVHGA